MCLQERQKIAMSQDRCSKLKQPMKSVEDDLKSIDDWLKKADKLMTSYESSGKDFEGNMSAYNVSFC